MPRISYINGQYLPHAHAGSPLESRGLQFADGVYEVIELIGGHIWDEEAHITRLRRSREALGIAAPMSDAALALVMRELIAKNKTQKGLLYIQVNRGVAPRNHDFPKKPVPPELIMTLMPAKTPSLEHYSNGMTAITHPDTRWQRCDIKSVSLLANILLKQKAAEAGARECILLAEDGTVREGSASNIFIVDKDGALHTHPANEHILNGTVRLRVFELAKANGIQVHEQPFDKKAMNEAKEIFITSTSAHVLPIAAIDGKPVGNGSPGLTTLKLIHAYHKMLFDQTGIQCPTPSL